MIIITQVFYNMGSTVWGGVKSNEAPPPPVENVHNVIIPLSVSIPSITSIPSIPLPPTSPSITPPMNDSDIGIEVV